MRRSKEIGKNIFVNLDDEGLNKVDEFLSKYGIKIYWLLSDGVMFEFPDEIITKNYPGDLSFYDSKTNSLILTYLENFDYLEFLVDDKVVYSVPITE